MALDRFLARTGAPLLTTYKAKGLVPEGDWRVIGGLGLSPRADAIIRPLIDAADLIVLAGYDPIEMRQGWRHPWPDGKPVIDIVAEPMQHGMHHSSLLLEGDVGAILARLVEGLTARSVWPGTGAGGGPRGVPRRLHRPLSAGGLMPSSRRCGGSRRPARSRQPILARIASCSARCGTAMGRAAFCSRAGLHHGLRLAAGAGRRALGSGHPTLCFVGDAGLEMVLGELATLRDLGLPVIVVALVDKALGLIALKQRQLGLARNGVDIGETDFAAVARHGRTWRDNRG